MNRILIEKSSWFKELEPEQKALIHDGLQLLELEIEALGSGSKKEQYYDYSFVLFPFSKAYEGFLKHYLYRLNLIDKETLESRRFRIGRAINPDVRKNQRDENWFYEDIERLCGSHTARQLWDTWLVCRNRVFHYFPPKVKHLSITQAQDSVQLVIDSLRIAIECRIENEK